MGPCLAALGLWRLTMYFCTGLMYHRQVFAPPGGWRLDGQCDDDLRHQKLIADHAGENYGLYEAHVNPRFAKALRIVNLSSGFHGLTTGAERDRGVQGKLRRVAACRQDRSVIRALGNPNVCASYMTLPA